MHIHRVVVLNRRKQVHGSFVLLTMRLSLVGKQKKKNIVYERFRVRPWYNRGASSGMSAERNSKSTLMDRRRVATTTKGGRPFTAADPVSCKSRRKRKE